MFSRKARDLLADVTAPRFLLSLSLGQPPGQRLRDGKEKGGTFAPRPWARAGPAHLPRKPRLSRRPRTAPGVLLVLPEQSGRICAQRKVKDAEFLEIVTNQREPNRTRKAACVCACVCVMVGAPRQGCFLSMGQEAHEGVAEGLLPVRCPVWGCRPHAAII